MENIGKYYIETMIQTKLFFIFNVKLKRVVHSFKIKVYFKH